MAELPVLHAVTTVVVFSFLFAYATSIEFKVTWYEGKFQVFKYNYSIFGDCVYSSANDLIKCMRDHSFKKVEDTWRYRPEIVQYISVRCQKQVYYPDHSHVCICKNGSDAANPGLSIQHDSFYFCQLKKLPNRMFSKLKSMEVLDLSDNVIVDIQGDALQSVVSLKYLDLSRNPLSHLAGGFLCDASGLEILRMESTHFFNFPYHIFDCDKAMTNLTYVDLSQNIIHSIPNFAFKNIPNILSLNLSSNNFSIIPQNAFYGANKLMSLDLSENFLSVIPTGLCKNLPSLHYLHLSKNRFTKIKIQEISECPRIHSLDLSFNNIKTVQGELINSSDIITLKLSKNFLESLSTPNFLEEARKLENLDLSMNTLREIVPKTFNGLGTLKNLDLSDNILNESIQLNEILKPLTDLRILDLSVNQFRIIKAESFYFQNKLSSLSFARNRIERIEQKAFDGLSALVSLDLKYNKISSFPDEVMSSMTKLEFLDVSHNNILSLDGFLIPTSLKTVNIQRNRLEHFPQCFANCSIQTLLLDRNEISSLSKSMLASLSSVESMSISRNRISFIEDYAFSDLSNLTNLDLSRNKLKFDFSYDVFSGASNLVHLNLSQNEISGIDGFLSYNTFSNLETLNMSMNPVKQIHGLLRQNAEQNGPTRLKYLYLNSCKIRSVQSTSFDGLQKLEMVDLSKNFISEFQPFSNIKPNYIMKNNPLECTCNMKWILGTNRSIPIYKYRVNTCAVYPLNISLPVHTVADDQFLCKMDGCHANCSCFSRNSGGNVDVVICSNGLSEVPNPLPRTAKHMYLSGNKFSDLHFQEGTIPEYLTEELCLNKSDIVTIHDNFFYNFKHLKLLHLNENNLIEIKAGTFSKLSSLEELYLQKNKLRKVESDLLSGLSSLRVLDLRKNSLEHLPFEILDGITKLSTFRWAYLGDNPWKCDCANRDFRIWIDKYRSRIHDLNEIRCGDVAMKWVDLERFDCDQESGKSSINKKGIIVTSVILTSVFAIFLAAVLYYRREIMAFFFKKFHLACFRRKYEENKLYDIFLMYDTNDTKGTDWVNSYLLPRLQKNNKFRLVIPDRTKLADSVIDTESAKIYDSKSFVFVVTKYISGNQYCCDCFTKAWSHSLINKNFNIILLICGDIDFSLLEPNMRKLLSTGNYITTRSRSMWDRLFYELPDPHPRFQPFRDDDDVSESDVIIYNIGQARSPDDYGTVLIK